MKSKNDKTNPFSRRVTFLEIVADFNAGADRGSAAHRVERRADLKSAAHKVLSLIIRSPQKNIRFTTDLTKLGPLKNEEPKPTFKPPSAPYHTMSQSLATTAMPPMKRPIFMVFQAKFQGQDARATPSVAWPSRPCLTVSRARCPCHACPWEHSK